MKLDANELPLKPVTSGGRMVTAAYTACSVGAFALGARSRIEIGEGQTLQKMLGKGEPMVTAMRGDAGLELVPGVNARNYKVCATAFEGYGIPRVSLGECVGARSMAVRK